MRKIALERLHDESIHLAFCIFGNFLFSYNIYLSSAVCKYKELFFQPISKTISILMHALISGSYMTMIKLITIDRAAAGAGYWPCQGGGVDWQDCYHTKEGFITKKSLIIHDNGVVSLLVVTFSHPRVLLILLRHFVPEHPGLLLLGPISS